MSATIANAAKSANVAKRAARQGWHAIAWGSLSAVVLIALMGLLLIGLPSAPHMPGASHEALLQALAQRARERGDEAASARSYAIAHTDLLSYCPPPMALPDAGRYGDQQFQASAGDLTNEARYAMFGSAYSASITNITAQRADPNTPALATLSKSIEELAAQSSLQSSPQNSSQSPAQNSAQGTPSSQNSTPSTVPSASPSALPSAAPNSFVPTLARHHDTPTIIRTKVLHAQQGSGEVSSVASWATKGDLQGMSATSCLTPALDQTLMSPAPRAGSHQTLLVANPSSKATTVQLVVHGTSSGAALQLPTGNSLAVPAYGLATLDIAAGLSAEQGLLVQVMSKDTPIAAMIRVTQLQGLTPQGVDTITPMSSSLAQPSSEASSERTIAGLLPGDKATIYTQSDADTTLQLTWLGAATPLRSVNLTAGAVHAVDLGAVPEGAYALSVQRVAATPNDLPNTSPHDSSHAASHTAPKPYVPWHVALKATRGNDGAQQDFAMLNATPQQQYAAIAIPQGASGALTFANAAQRALTLTLTSYDDAGKMLATRTLTLAPRNAQLLALRDIASGSSPDTAQDASPSATSSQSVAAVVVRADEGGVAWGVRLAQSNLDAARVAAVAYVGASSLQPRAQRVTAIMDQGIVH